MAHGHDLSPSLGELTAPRRNQFFYGKMMGVRSFEMEQEYFNRQRWLLNRVSLGGGVLCGLEVTVAEDGTTVWVRPGVAVDGLGREIVVPAPYCIEDPRQPTDDCGRPLGDPIAGAGVVTLSLCYHECGAEPVPVLVADCDTRGECSPSVVVERFHLLIKEGAASTPVGLTDEQCAAIFPDEEPDGFDRRAAACEALAGECLADEECVALATITLPETAGDPVTVDECGARTTVYSNSRLFDLLMCLGDKVGECCDHLSLRYVSGDAQSAEPGQELADPLVVEVVDADGNAVEGETVTFAIRGGGGTATPASVPSDASGRAEVRWRLGPAAGLNTMAATIEHAPEVTLFALGTAAEQPPPVGDPPVVIHVWPDYALRLTAAAGADFEEWVGRPIFAITFDREMDKDQMAEPDALSKWLRIHRVRDRGEIEVEPLRLELIDITDPFRGRAGFTAVFGLGVEEPQDPSRYLVQMRADGGNITDVGTPRLTLDAEFAGTKVPEELLQHIWDQGGAEFHGREVWDGLVDQGIVLPKSGDTAEGGHFHGWFEIARR